MLENIYIIHSYPLLTCESATSVDIVFVKGHQLFLGICRQELLGLSVKIVTSWAVVIVGSTLPYCYVVGMAVFIISRCLLFLSWQALNASG